MKAILSVSNKAGLVDFAKGLEKLNVDIYSTGGTKKALADAGVKVHSVSDLTGFPEILNGRVKTLHPMVHGGILARRDKPDHMKELDSNKIDPIDMVVVNLYPFVQTVAKPDVTLADALENIETATEGLPQTVARVNRALKRIDRVVATQKETFSEVTRNLEVLSDNLRELMDMLKRQPSQAIFGGPPPRVREREKR